MTHLSHWAAVLTIAAPVLGVSLSYSTYLGAGGMDSVTAVTADRSRCIYVAGWTETAGSGVDAFVKKLSPDGARILWSVMLSGDGDDRATGVAVGSDGNVWVTGWTSSGNFPIRGAYQPSKAGGRDAFLTELTADGAIVFSTFFGGAGNDIATAVAVDGEGYVYIAGETSSANLPVRNPVQGGGRGGTDAFFAKFFPSGDTLVFSTYLGGCLDDRANAIAIDGSGNAWVTGETYSADFPTAGALRPVSGGGQDAFVFKLGPRGNLLYSTYLGGSGGAPGLPESGRAIAVDGTGAAYIAGSTSSSNFPLAGAAQSQFAGGVTDCFVVKMNAGGSALAYSTYLGGTSVDYCTGIAVDAAGAAWVVGYTASTDLVMKAAEQASNAGLYDAFVVELAPNGALAQSTYLGGSASDSANAVALATNGVYVAGQTGSANFPLRSAAQAGPAGAFDGFVARFGPTPALFVPLTPCRVVDTRGVAAPLGGPGLGSGEARSFAIPAGACGVPSGAVAYAVNLTVVPRRALGFLTAWPTGKPRPVVSTLSSLDGRVKANAALIPAGDFGAVTIFASDPADVVLDIQGYFTASSSEQRLAFYPLAPCRVLDTRSPAGPLGGPSLGAGVARNVPVRSSGCDVPAWASAYSLNLTALPHGKLGYLTVWPGGSPQPLVSTLNAPTGQVTANAAFIQAGPDGSVLVLATDIADLAIDINGYFAPPGGGGLSFYPMDLCRAVDSRSPPGAFGAPAVHGLRSFALAGSACGAPIADFYSLNATVVPYAFLGYLTLWASGAPQPRVSTLNSFDGSIVSNYAVAPATNDSVNVFTSDLTELVLDINGYFAP
jgi:hypothetical protein